MSWEKKIHVASSMPKKDGQFVLMIGRWQSVNENGTAPALHNGHRQLFQQVLDEGGNVLIAIRDIEPDEKNPFTAREIFDHIVSEEYSEEIFMGRVRVMILPEDISAVAFGRGVGYDIVEYIPPAEIAEISATKIREKSIW